MCQGLSVSEVQALLRQSLVTVQEQGPTAGVLVNRLIDVLRRRTLSRVRVEAERALAISLERQLPQDARQTRRQRSIYRPPSA